MPNNCLGQRHCFFTVHEKCAFTSEWSIKEISLSYKEMYLGPFAGAAILSLSWIVVVGNDHHHYTFILSRLERKTNWAFNNVIVTNIFVVLVRHMFKSQLWTWRTFAFSLPQRRSAGDKKSWELVLRNVKLSFLYLRGCGGVRPLWPAH